MQNLYISLLGVCLLGSVCSASVWDDYLDDGIPAEPVKLDGEERKPLVLVEPSKDDCKVYSFTEILEQFASDGEPKTPRGIWRSKAVAFCKQISEKGITDALANLDDKLKDRLEPLIDVLTKANRGEEIKLQRFFMPEENLQSGILSELERRGADLSSIKTFDQFDEHYSALLKDCKEAHRSLYRDVNVYKLLLDRQKVETDPTVEKWTRNTVICGYLLDDILPYERSAYNLLEERLKPTKEESQSARKKSGGLLKCFKPFSKKS